MHIDKPTKPFSWVAQLPEVLVARKCRTINWRGIVPYEGKEVDCARAKAEGAAKSLELIEQTVD